MYILFILHMRTVQSVGLVLQYYISIETLSWVTQLKIGDICLCII